MDVDEVKHFLTGEPIARVGRANAGLIQRDMRKASNARDALRKIPVAELVARMKVAGDLYMNAELPLGDGSQTPDDFAKQQSASTGLPVAMCRELPAKVSTNRLFVRTRNWNGWRKNLSACAW